MHICWSLSYTGSLENVWETFLVYYTIPVMDVAAFVFQPKALPQLRNEWDCFFPKDTRGLDSNWNKKMGRSNTRVVHLLPLLSLFGYQTHGPSSEDRCRFKGTNVFMYVCEVPHQPLPLLQEAKLMPSGHLPSDQKTPEGSSLKVLWQRSVLDG